MNDTIKKDVHIGAVRVTYLESYHNESSHYGNVEVVNKLYNQFRENKDDSQTAYKEQYSNLAEEYHLSPVRQNILKWYPFNKKGRMLEIGAQCGAITGLLCDKLEKVVALEVNEKMALTTAYRHSTLQNLEILVGNLDDLDEKEHFDYITCIGELTHIMTSYSCEKEIKSLFLKLKDLLNPDGGVLLLAIGNNNQLKDNPYSKTQCIDKNELSMLLKTNGLNYLRWYHLFPDYILPRHIVSEDLYTYDSKGTCSNDTLIPREVRNNEAISMEKHNEKLRNGELDDGCLNTFLVEACSDKKSSNRVCLSFSAANRCRRPENRTSIAIYNVGDEKQVVKCQEAGYSNNFLKQIVYAEFLAKEFFSDKAEVVTGLFEEDCLLYPYLEYPSVEDHIAKSIQNGDSSFARAWLDKYIQFLRSLPSEKTIPSNFMNNFNIPDSEILQPVECIKCGIIDCIPRNIKVGKHSWYIIDNEWTHDFSIPTDYIIFRGLATLVVGLQRQIQMAVKPDATVILFSGWGNNCLYIPSSWFEIISNMELPFEYMARWERHFQHKVLLGNRTLRLRLRKNPRVLTKVKVSNISKKRGIIKHFGSKLKGFVKDLI